MTPTYGLFKVIAEGEGKSGFWLGGGIVTDVYIHVGLPKTGTTFLQERCFPNLKGVHFVYKANYARPAGIIERLWRVAAAYPLFGDMNEQRAEVDRFIRGVVDDKILISSERLIGDPIWAFHDHVQVTDSLRYLFPGAKIIVTIRRQDDFLESLYKQYLKAYFSAKIDDYLSYTDGQFENWCRPPWVFPSFNVWNLDYHVYSQNYAAAFGRQNVLVLPNEMLREDPRRFHDKLAAFMDVEPYCPPSENAIVNRGYSSLSCRIALLLNRFVRAPRHEKQPWQIIPHEPLTPYLSRHDQQGPSYRILDALNRRLSLRYMLENVVDRLAGHQGSIIHDERRRLILEIHRESNRRLDEEYAINLKQYGYY